MEGMSMFFTATDAPAKALRDFNSLIERHPSLRTPARELGELIDGPDKGRDTDTVLCAAYHRFRVAVLQIYGTQKGVSAQRRFTRHLNYFLPRLRRALEDRAARSLGDAAAIRMYTAPDAPCPAA